MTSRFSDAASQARAGVPRGVRPGEGWAVVAMAVVLFLGNAVVFQAPNLPWGGIVRMAAQVIVLLGIMVTAVLADRFRGVHPTGYHRTVWAAGAWGVAVVAPAGWWWIAQGPTDTSATLPLGVAGVRLALAAR